MNSSAIAFAVSLSEKCLQIIVGWPGFIEVFSTTFVIERESDKVGIWAANTVIAILCFSTQFLLCRRFPDCIFSRRGTNVSSEWSATCCEHNGVLLISWFDTVGGDNKEHFGTNCYILAQKQTFKWPISKPGTKHSRMLVKLATEPEHNVLLMRNCFSEKSDGKLQAEKVKLC